MTYIGLERVRAGRYRAMEMHSGVPLGHVFAVPNEPDGQHWMVGYLMGREGIVRHATLAAVKVELERYCRQNPAEIEAARSAILAARARLESAEVPEPAPVLQAAMPL